MLGRCETGVCDGDEAAGPSSGDIAELSGGSPGRMAEDPTLPTNLKEAAAALAESVRRDACSLCLSPDKLNEIISGAVDAVRDPMG